MLAPLALVALAACAAPGTRAGGGARSPVETYRELLGPNAGLNAVRAVVEARIAYAGREVSLPGVLQLDALGGFRLELLDPLDRPLAVIYPEGGRVVQYRPALKLAASLGLFPGECRGVGAADWAQAVVASSAAPAAGERLQDRVVWGSDRSLERHRGGALHESIRYTTRGERLRPRTFSWYCDDEAVMQLQVREWVEGAQWRLPAQLEVEYPLAGLSVRLELREIEANPPPTGLPLLPQPGPETRWTRWNLPR